MKKLKGFIKSEAVLLISTLAALITMFFVPPSTDYISYIDFRTLALLFCLMTAVAGLKSIGFFDRLAMSIIPRFKNSRTLCLILVLLCFFSSMLITNDVALITFVPFTIIIFSASNLTDRLVYTIVLETAAANLGSMLTPLGNPQNLYLYSYYRINPGEFFQITFPLCLLGLILLVLFSFICRKQPIMPVEREVPVITHKKRLVIYIILFLLSLLTVFHVLDYRLTLVVLLIILLFTDKKLILKADYGLLLTFVCFFVFVGNLERIPSVHAVLTSFIRERELLSGILLSQVISNVPAAVLLSGFTDKYRQLLLGTNIGGLGTIIASLASLISFKFYAALKPSRPLYYLAVFTAVNVLLLIPLLVFALFI